MSTRIVDIRVFYLRGLVFCWNVMLSAVYRDNVLYFFSLSPDEFFDSTIKTAKTVFFQILTYVQFLIIFLFKSALINFASFCSLTVSMSVTDVRS